MYVIFCLAHPKTTNKGTRVTKSTRRAVGWICIWIVHLPNMLTSSQHLYNMNEMLQDSKSILIFISQSKYRDQCLSDPPVTWPRVSQRRKSMKNSCEGECFLLKRHALASSFNRKTLSFASVFLLILPLGFCVTWTNKTVNYCLFNIVLRNSAVVKIKKRLSRNY